MQRDGMVPEMVCRLGLSAKSNWMAATRQWFASTDADSLGALFDSNGRIDIATPRSRGASIENDNAAWVAFVHRPFDSGSDQ